nr:MarR family winged helix-turn-helix transcriptional regulator [uncultured Schaedlerella sp.]
MDGQVKRQIDVINQLIKELNSLYHIAAVKSGVSDGEICVWSILLTTDKEYSQQDLCELLFLPKQTINSIISGLIKKGYVFLEHVPGTRNRKVIRLSDEGRNYGVKNIMWIFEAEQHAMEDADPREICTLISMLEKYINKLKREFTEN